jgi:hypothetical protein
MTEYELISLVRATSTAVAADFEFFVGATFAVIVTSYVAGDKLTRLARIVLSLLYMTATVLFFLRYQTLVVQAQFFVGELRAMESGFLGARSLTLVPWIRMLLVFLGSVAALWTLFLPVLGERGRVADP